MAEPAIGRSIRVNPGERYACGLRPDGLLFHVRVGELIAGEILSQPVGNFGIGFEGNDATFGTDQARGHQRKESDVRADVVKRHSRPQMVNEGLLHLRLTDSLLYILAGAGIQANPEAFGGAALYLHPDEGVAGDKFPAAPT